MYYTGPGENYLRRVAITYTYESSTCESMRATALLYQVATDPEQLLFV